MNKKTLMELHCDLCKKACILIEKKNADYGASSNDALINFKETARAEGLSPAKGILLRIQDKLRRINSFDKTSEYKVADEKVEDTIIDLINYSIFLAAILKEKGK